MSQVLDAPLWYISFDIMHQYEQLVAQSLFLYHRNYLFPDTALQTYMNTFHKIVMYWDWRCSLGWSAIHEIIDPNEIVLWTNKLNTISFLFFRMFISLLGFFNTLLSWQMYPPSVIRIVADGSEFEVNRPKHTISVIRRILYWLSVSNAALMDANVFWGFLLGLSVLSACEKWLKVCFHEE